MPRLALTRRRADFQVIAEASGSVERCHLGKCVHFKLGVITSAHTAHKHDSSSSSSQTKAGLRECAYLKKGGSSYYNYQTDGIPFPPSTRFAR
ncbi:unnamed protein product [Mesocestoides corti]|uniref:Uncharacterized protein n=1 Tax=Mesocestoides corti TaxID=53468 RepID=A0A0R3UGT6_MESCO|nr:unnamed protein product [Mesocestoides corti]